MRRRWIGAAVAGIAGAVLVAGAVSIAIAPAATSVEARVSAIAQTLKCPTCVGESVADSAAPVSVAMRGVIEEQVREGRTPAEVRDWFVARYGEAVLLDPPLWGAGWLLWTLPVLLVAAVVALAILRRGRPPWLAIGIAAAGAGVTIAVWAVAGTPAGRPATDAVADPGSALEVAVRSDPGDAELRIALGRALEGEGRYGEAAEQYAAAVRLEPFDAELAFRHAAALARAGEPHSAAPVLDGLLEREPDHAPALLLRGTIAWNAGEPAAALLERFLEVAPDHPAATEAESMLADPTGGGP